MCQLHVDFFYKKKHETPPSPFLCGFGSTIDKQTSFSEFAVKDGNEDCGGWGSIEHAPIKIPEGYLADDVALDQILSKLPVTIITILVMKTKQNYVQNDLLNASLVKHILGHVI